ncbi:MAG TPA: EAL domain-containing response regulator [Noviherbaspirillum sp.]|nr:EAL domain-containing response regulator [Noviherbaspirillum sp.]
MKILILDDEPFMLKLLERQLAVLGFAKIVGHLRARDALAVVTSEPDAVGLVFCDLQMPEMDGVEFVRQLAQTGYTGGLVLVSGEEERVLQTAQRLAQAHGLNVLGVLRKPVLLDGLRQVMESHPVRSFSVPLATYKSYDADDLRRAIAGSELVNHYQPKVDLATGVLSGVETLVRWQHPQDGLVYPDRFITLAEDNGLIDSLTHVVLERAMRDARAWLDAGLALHVAVNVSMDSLGALDFPDFVARLAATAGVPLKQLVLEVTESRLLKNPQAALDVFTRLRLKRVGLSIDDFGTGHSSLTQLHDIPFDELKVDRGFVHDASRNASSRAIVEASLGMARQLNMKTVAEGVENREDWDFLRVAGCGVAQGYFIARPMPAAELPGWLVLWDKTRHELLRPVI